MIALLIVILLIAAIICFAVDFARGKSLVSLGLALVATAMLLGTGILDNLRA